MLIYSVGDMVIRSIVFFLTFMILINLLNSSEFEPHQKLITGDNGFEMLVDYDKLTFTIEGREYPFHIDYPECLDEQGRIEFREDLRTSLTRQDTVWVHLPYDRFDVYVDSVYYYDNTPDIDEFFDLFEPRFDLLEATTGWCSEEVVSEGAPKLVIYVSEGTLCWGGTAYLTEAYLFLSNPLYKENCKRSYYEDFQGDPLLGNQGELGDFWVYMSGAVHETLHSINPFYFIHRNWITEGYSAYYDVNLLTLYGDINQETSDTYTINGVVPYNWGGYITNDYKDNSVDERELQESKGYHITAWMLSMLRDVHDLNWDTFYLQINNNRETLDSASWMYQISDYFTDMVFIDLCGRALGISSDSIEAIFRYDGPSGPGWGVRQWVDRSWYADLQSRIDYSYPNVTLVINNTGDVTLENVLVKLYDSTIVLYIDTVDVVAQDSTIIIDAVVLSDGWHELVLTIDEADVKIEIDDANNDDSLSVYVTCCNLRGDALHDNQLILVNDLVFLVNYVFKGGPPPICLEEGDALADNGLILVNDLVYLVNYVFKGGDPPPDC